MVKVNNKSKQESPKQVGQNLPAKDVAPGSIVKYCDSWWIVHKNGEAFNLTNTINMKHTMKIKPTTTLTPYLRDGGTSWVDYWDAESKKKGNRR